MNEPLAAFPSTDSTGERSDDRRLRAVENWVFDLDNTLYPPSSNLFDQIDIRIGMFLQDCLALGPAGAPGRCKSNTFAATGPPCMD